MRLYPTVSPMRTQAVNRFVSLVNEVTSLTGPLRFGVEPKGFKIGEDPYGENVTQVSSLAETLYRHQVGQMLVSPGLDEKEATAFLERITLDADKIKEDGGLRSALKKAGVTHLAVTEVRLRVSEEEECYLAAAPPEDIGPVVAQAATRWLKTSYEGEGVDELSEGFGSLEDTDRIAATDRVAQALLQLDEKARVDVIKAACQRDKHGKSMQGMLAVIGRMGPNALARMLRLVAHADGLSPLDVLSEIEIPPELFRALQSVLSPSPQDEASRGVPSRPDMPLIAKEAVIIEDDVSHIRDLVAASTPAETMVRALVTGCMLMERNPSTENIIALTDASITSIQAGNWAGLRGTFQILRDSFGNEILDEAIEEARKRLSDTEVFSKACSTASTPDETESLTDLIDFVGEDGYDVFLDCWTSGDPEMRTRLSESITVLGEPLIIASGRHLRHADADTARSIMELLGEFGDRRALLILLDALEHDDVEVRISAINALGKAGAGSMLGDALDHPDSRTRIAAAKEIGRIRSKEGLSALHKVLEQYHLVEKDRAFKEEVMRSVLSMGFPESRAVLEHVANRRFVFGQGNNALKRLAVTTIKDLASADAHDSEESMSRD